MLPPCDEGRDEADGDQDQRDDGRGVEHLVVILLAGVLEEEAVFDAHAFADGLFDLYPALLIGRGEQVEAGECCADGEAAAACQANCQLRSDMIRRSVMPASR